MITPADLVGKHSLQTLSAPSPGMLVIKNAFIDPEFCSAYHAETGELIIESVTRRGQSLGADPRVKAKIDTPFAPIIGKSGCPVVDKCLLLPLPFQGCNHFGHLITEVVAMLYPIMTSRPHWDWPMPVYIGSLQWRKSSRYHQELRDFLSPTIIDPASSPVLIRNLFIPLPTLYLRHSFSVLHRQALRSVLPVLFRDMSLSSADESPLPSVQEGKKIYLSRARLPSNKRKVINEEKLEGLLVAQGWEIIHPQLLSIRQQLIKLAEAQVVAGCLGSAFHLLQYLNAENLEQKKILSIGLDRSLYLKYALKHSLDDSTAICALALSRDPSDDRKTISCNLVIDVDEINQLSSWLCQQ
jgi:hypothetical protein